MQQIAKILIVDDEPFNVAVLEQELDDLGYDTISAANGQEALDLVAAEAPDLVLLDVMMPIMDGFAVLARLKAAPATRDIPVIVISASNDMPSVVRGIKQGAEDYLPKPFDPVLLQARISACLEKKWLRDQELEYLRRVELFTQAAAAIETNTFDETSLADEAELGDALGGLARVLARMAREVHTREQRLRLQLQQLRLDLEERRLAAAETVALYVPIDRRQALARGESLTEYARGAALVADVSGFTALTEALAQRLGLQRGAEEITRQLNRVYGVLITQVHRYGGSVIGFSGDAITCWFDDGGWEMGDRGWESDDTSLSPTPNSHLPTPAALRAAACGLAMQMAMQQFATFATPAGPAIELAIKVALAAGEVRRFLVGDPQTQQLEVLTGLVIDAMAAGEHLAGRGDVLVHTSIVEATGTHLSVADWRADPATGERFAMALALAEPVPEAPWPDLPPGSLADEQCRPWLLPLVYERVREGRSEFLSELRPVAALFLSFQGIEYNADQRAGAKLDAFVRWVHAVLARHGGALLQVTIGDKGSYLYAAFGAPTAHEDDAARAVAAAFDLLALPDDLAYIAGCAIGLAYGQMRAGAYGGATQRTYGVLGDKTNLAARLMQAASDGATILCDEAIYGATQMEFAFEALPPIPVKGKAQPVAVYRPMPRPPSALVDQIDRLAPAHQLTLKVASVIGASFGPELLRDIYPNASDKPGLEEHLQHLEQHGLVRRRPAQPPGQDPFVFATLQIQTLAYSRLLFAQRRQLHRAVAEWYEQNQPADLALRYALLAHHWRQAEDAAKAIEYLELAGEYARQHGDHHAALAYFNQSLALNAQAGVLSRDYYPPDLPDLRPPREHEE